jgi:GTPase
LTHLEGCRNTFLIILIKGLILFERPRSGERAILVSLILRDGSAPADAHEFGELARAAGAQTMALLRGSRVAPHPAFFVGSGKVEEIRAALEQHQAELVLFNHELSPAQERNLERELKCRVLDRTGLILDIFAQRARSFEGKLQVELAQLEHLSTRLVRGWTHLERQKGGIGLRGPGETQLETDRRLLGERIKQIKKRLEKVRQQRKQGRRARERADIPSVSLVGYTNAGKSTLFNYLTESSVFVADQLFATLDPTFRRLDLPGKTPLILADTVGFVQHLPHKLVEAFRSTLEETVQADILLHLVDSSDPERLMRIEQVNQVLHSIGANEIPQIIVYNKIDRLDADKDNPMPRIEHDEHGLSARVWLSAKTGQGVDLLRQALREHLQPLHEIRWVRIPVIAAQARARCHEWGTVQQEYFEPNGDCLLQLDIAAPLIVRLCDIYPNLTLYSKKPD